MSLSAPRKHELTALCRRFRLDVIDTLHLRQTGHPGGSLSVCEILAILYFQHANVSADDPAREDRDMIILSKGHAAPMLYRVLAEKGFFPKEEMKSLRTLNTRLQGHPCSHETPGVEISSGPLGLGLSAGLGISLGQKLRGYKNACTYVILGDGELDEGTVWEAAMSASRFKADNLIAVVDCNKVQLDGTTDEIMPLGNLTDKFSAFGFEVISCDGHDLDSLDDAFKAAKTVKDKPSVILADTVKGKGVSFMEGKNIWHGAPISDDLCKQAMSELREGK